tara:strand:+ start:471 stop:941 length:471 start_codon:yes stop_codon:yes gene_type:complete
MNSKRFAQIINWILWPSLGATSLLVLILLFTIYLHQNPTARLVDSQSNKETTIEKKSEPEIVEGVHLATGLVDAEGLQMVINNCTNCHSSKLITQNRMSAERWQQTIDWMQRTQNLWDLGENEAVIVNYLAANYAPESKGRRQRLKEIEWYRLEIE